MSGVAVRQACRRLTIVSLVALVLYVGFAAIASVFPDVEQVEGARFWPAFLPDWPIAFLLLLAAALAVCDAVLWALARSARATNASDSRRWRRDGGSGRTPRWPPPAATRRSACRRSAPSRCPAVRVSRGPRRRAPTTGSSSCARERGSPCRPGRPWVRPSRTKGWRPGFVDEGLAPDRVYFYTAFAEARGEGQWSPPAWSSITTPPPSLRDVLTPRRLWTLRG